MTEKQTVKRIRSEVEDTDTSSADIILLLQGLNSKMDVLTSTVSDNSMAINNIDAKLTAKIDKLEMSVADSINKVKVEVDAQIADLATNINDRFNYLSASTQKSCEENAKISHDMQFVNESRFNKLERELLRNELIVNGVPVVHGESLFNIIGEIVNALQSNVNSTDIVASYRLPVRKVSAGRLHNERLSSPIVLKLGSDWAKQDIFSNYFKMKNLNTGDIGYQSKSRIYINESLTSLNRAIFKAATDAKKSKLITKCYTRNGIVLIQMSNEGKIFRVYDVDQLNAIITSSSTNPMQKSNKKSPTDVSQSTGSVNSKSPTKNNMQYNGSSNSNTPQLNPTPTTAATTVTMKSMTPTKPDGNGTMHDGEPMDGQ